MGIFDFFKKKNNAGSLNYTNKNPVVEKLISCTELASEEILSIIKIKKEREIELYFRLFFNLYKIQNHYK